MWFTVTLRTSHLWHSHFSDYHELLSKTIKREHASRMGSRNITHWLNEHGYKTLRGHEFQNAHVFSLLKKQARDNRLNVRHKRERENLRMYLLNAPITADKNDNY